jgi:hypothetical protein
LRASLRGLLLVRPDTRSLLEAMIAHDVVSVLLDETTDRDPAMRADLAIRVAALFDFYASVEFLTLRRALCG